MAVGAIQGYQPVNNLITSIGGPEKLGLKREAGEIPARSRHCNWCGPPKKIATVPASRDGKAGVRTGTRSQETCLGHDLMHFAKEGVSRYVSVTT